MCRRERSQQQLQVQLVAKGYPLNEILPILQQLQQEGYLSDIRYTEAYIRSRRERGYGPVRIAMELKNAGVSDEVIDAKLDYNDPEWQQALNKLQRKRLASRNKQDLKEIVRFQRFLHYRGFTSEQIKVSLTD